MSDRARFYRYRGLVVKVSEDEIAPVWLHGVLATATPSLAPLPKRYRREIRQALAEREAEVA